MFLCEQRFQRFSEITRWWKNWVAFLALPASLRNPVAGIAALLGCAKALGEGRLLGIRRQGSANRREGVGSSVATTNAI